LGALTSKPYTFNARPWELRFSFVIDVFDGLGAILCVDSRGLDLLRVRPFVSAGFDEWITDKARFAFDSYSRQRLVAPLFSGLVLLRSMFYLPKTGWFFVFNHLYKKYWLNKLRLLLASYSLGVVSRGVFSLVFFASFLDLEFLSVAKGYFKRLFSFSLFEFSGELADFASFYLLSAEIKKQDLVFFLGLNTRLELPLFHLKARQALLRQKLTLLTFASSFDNQALSLDLGSSLSFLLSFCVGRNRYSKLFYLTIKKPCMLVKL